MKWVIFFLFISGFAFLAFIFTPVLNQEIKYKFNQITQVKYVVGAEQLGTFEKPLFPANTSFSILIPKIGAVAPIIDDVNPASPANYLPALREGIARAAGTAYPGSAGNVFLFAHSQDAFWKVSTYNTVFYLIGKLNPGDEIDIYYQGNLFKYKVYDKKIVSPDSSQYFHLEGKTLTLQTLYPPGTTFQRLIVLAKQE